jgi:hypothetical protein
MILVLLIILLFIFTDLKLLSGFFTSYIIPLTSYLLHHTSYIIPLTSHLLHHTSYIIPLTSDFRLKITQRFFQLRQCNLRLFRIRCDSMPFMRAHHEIDSLSHLSFHQDDNRFLFSCC